MRPTILRYDHGRFQFDKILREIFAVEDLARLAPDEALPLLTWQTDQATPAHAKYYEAFGSHIESLYREFVASFVPDVLGTKEFCFQRVPTFRVHFPGNIAVGEFHTDGNYNHRAGEINFWVPFTKAWGSNTVWIEHELGSADYRPMELGPGEVLVFDAVHWHHGNKVNETGSTRVSFDFRCIPLSDYTQSDLRTVDAGRGLWIGDYFDVF
jgi:hypothetical protein